MTFKELSVLHAEKYDFSVFQDPAFRFDEEKHLYTYKDKPLISVTTWLHQFKPSFDSEFWSMKKANELGVSVEEILESWALTAKTATDLGTIVHKYLEERFSFLKISEVENLEARYRIELFERFFIEKNLSRLIPIKLELRVFLASIGIAGTIDNISEHNGDLYILDYKTNSKFNTDTDRCYQRLNAPFSDLLDNEENLYSLQLSMYDLILEMNGIKIKDKYLIWIPGKSKSGEEQYPKVFRTKDFKPRLKKMFGIV